MLWGQQVGGGERQGLYLPGLGFTYTQRVHSECTLTVLPMKQTNDYGSSDKTADAKLITVWYYIRGACAELTTQMKG